MTKGLRGALLAPLFGALLLLGAPSATYAAQPQPGDPPAGQRDDKDKAAKPDPGEDAKAGDQNSGKDPKAGGSSAGKDPKAGDDNAGKDPKAGDNKGDGRDGDGKKDGKDGDYGRRYDRDDGHYDHDRYGRHGRHGWDTHRRYYRHGYRGSGWYDDCGYYGPDSPDRYDGYYDSPDACDRQYGAQGESLRANLSGDQEVPKPGAPNSFGTANVFVDMGSGRLCYRLGYDGIEPPSAAHIHQGGPGQAGRPVIDLHPEANGDEGCVGADPTALRNLRDHPEAFYLNLHTPEYPDGAMRGQLFHTGY